MLPVMRPNASSHLRIARPTRNLAQAERFWVDGLQLDVLYRAAPDTDSNHALLMVGWHDAAWHLELIEDPDEETPPSPTEEDLLVLYLGGPIDHDVIERLLAAGGERVPSHNPYWDQWGVTLQDPDGYRLVLSHRSWP
jgi:catechol 2,3-dioxygenase-like lactoylglutathione lyase family enzyme